MKLYGRSEEVIANLIEIFESGNVAEPLAQVILNRVHGDSPMSSWSVLNQILCLAAGCTDARGFRQWKEADRHVKKGCTADAYILFPKIGKAKEDHPETGLKKGDQIVYGFSTAPVWDISHTAANDPDQEEEENRIIDEFIDSRPFIDVAKQWEIAVEVSNTRRHNALGIYYPGTKKIELGTENVGTWLHELIHAAEDRLGRLNEKDEGSWMTETVAELGSACLSIMTGQEQTDTGKAYRYISHYAEEAGITCYSACTKMIGRISAAIDLILTEADILQPAQ